MQVQPYLIFGGRCEEAIEFYKRALGARAMNRSPAPVTTGDEGERTCPR